jgi:hypothetical protein
MGLSEPAIVKPRQGLIDPRAGKTAPVLTDAVSKVIDDPAVSEFWRIVKEQSQRAKN